MKKQIAMLLKYLMFAWVIFLLHVLFSHALQLWSIATLYALLIATIFLSGVYALSVYAYQCYQPYYAARMSGLQRRGLTPEHIQDGILLVFGFAVLYLSEYLGSYLSVI